MGGRGWEGEDGDGRERMRGRGWEGEVGRERERMGGRGCGQLMNSGKFARFQKGTKYRPGKRHIFFST